MSCRSFTWATTTAVSVVTGSVTPPAWRAKAALSTRSFTPMLGITEPRATKSVELTVAPAALAAAAKAAPRVLASTAARRSAASRAFVRATSSRTLSSTSSSFGRYDGLISDEGDEGESLAGADGRADLALFELERLGRHGWCESETGERLLARKQAGVADGQSLLLRHTIEVGGRLDAWRHRRNHFRRFGPGLLEADAFLDLRPSLRPGFSSSPRACRSARMMWKPNGVLTRSLVCPC